MAKAPSTARSSGRKAPAGTFSVWERYARNGVPASAWKSVVGGKRDAHALDKKVLRARGTNPKSKELEIPPPLSRQHVNESEARILYYFDLANRAFGDKKIAQEFMTRKHPRFGVAPVAKLDTEWGGREVEQVLNAIIYGLPA